MRLAQLIKAIQKPWGNNCPPHTPGSSGEWKHRCTQCGAPC